MKISLPLEKWVLMKKKEALASQLSRSPSLLVAYSGGVDSAYLLFIAHSILGDRCRGIIADSSSLPRRELADAIELANSRNWPVDIIETREMEDPQYISNPVNRCYFCKHELFTRLGEYAEKNDFSAIAYGENADDAGDFRPGRQAAVKFKIMAPLFEAGLTKLDIRRLSREANLPTAEKAAQPCLSSRIAHGNPVTKEVLAQVEAGEDILRRAGFRIFRLRHHGTKGRVQVASSELSRLEDPQTRKVLEAALQSVGFGEVEFDSVGYQGASLR
jgi:uncharacterized protein